MAGPLKTLVSQMPEPSMLAGSKQVGSLRVLRVVHVLLVVAAGAGVLRLRAAGAGALRVLRVVH
eukprot:12040539-Heterocapsa_arctica.AAC.1